MRYYMFLSLLTPPYIILIFKFCENVIYTFILINTIVSLKPKPNKTLLVGENEIRSTYNNG